MTIQEKTPTGEPIYRYNDFEPKDFEFAVGDESNINEITKHIEKHIGSVDSVFHEIISNLVHIDIHWIKPSSNFPFHVFVTTGMSDKPMNVPNDFEDNKYSELCILLPSDWDIQYEDFKLLEEIFNGETNYWPIRWLKIVARFPHEYNSWLGWGHTIPNGEDAEPFASNTQLGCILLMPAMALPMEFHELKISEEKTIKFYCLYPLYKEEMDYKLNKGLDALITKFDKFGTSSVIDKNRPNTCLKKGLFGLW